MKDVAARAGVHHSTVSLCLKNSPRISESTRTRVLKIAREMGYRPHPYLSTLMHTRRRGRPGAGSTVLAFVTFSSTRHGWKSIIPGMEECFIHARRQAHSRGFRLEEFWSPLDQASPQRLGDILYARGVTGILLSTLLRPVETLNLQWDRFAVVALGPSLQDSRVHRVRTHHYQSMLTAIDNCLKLGYQRIGFFMTDHVNRKVEYRSFAPYLLKQYEWRDRSLPKPLITDNWSRSVFLDWVEAERPDVLIGINIRDATKWLKSAGYRIPEDIGLVSLSAPEAGPVSGTYENWKLQGIRAVNLLLDLVEENAFGREDDPNLILVPGLWNPGNTLRSRKGGPS